MDAPVAIVGGGPVGLMLALLLDRHGVPTVVFNTDETSRWHPKGNTHNSRTMEHYRRLGISSDIRKLGLPQNHPRDVAYFTRYNAWELARITLPSEAERMRIANVAELTDQVPEPLLRANQMYVERYLLEHARRRPNIILRFGWQVSGFSEDYSGVRTSAEHINGQKREEWRSRYLVGCDGGNSFVRRSLGIRYKGHDGLADTFLSGCMVSSYVSVPSLHRDILRDRKAWLYNVVSPEHRMLMISLDGGDEFLLMTKCKSSASLPSDEEIIRTIHRGVGENIPVSVIAKSPWSGGMALVADRFSMGRVFLAGDATHLFSPTGGFGMNTGIDGAANLAWKLTAALRGWAGSGLLASYETERRPVARRNTVAARLLTKRVGEVDIPANLEDDSDAGASARRKVGEFLLSFYPQFTSLGVELGARYDDSPLIHLDSEPPKDDPVHYQPSGIPGGRLPHIWLSEGGSKRSSIFDRLGVGFTLIRVGEEAPAASGFAEAARERRIPLQVLNIPKTPAWDLYQRKLVLVRPDQHIAWRGDHVPENIGEVLERTVGF